MPMCQYDKQRSTERSVVKCANVIDRQGIVGSAGL